MARKQDTAKGLAADQSNPDKSQIQNGDPRSGRNRDQRAQTLESGGPKPSLQTGTTGTKEGQVPAHTGLEVVDDNEHLNGNGTRVELEAPSNG